MVDVPLWCLITGGYLCKKMTIHRLFACSNGQTVIFHSHVELPQGIYPEWVWWKFSRKPHI